MITQSELKTVLQYNHENGSFVWLAVKPRTKVKVGDVAGCLDGQGYRVIKVNGDRYYAHRLVWLYLNGEFPKNQIDHISGDKDDNREINLRDTTTVENSRNAKRPKNNKSGAIGVYWFDSMSKWAACIKIKGKQTHLGSFHDYTDAVRARKTAEAKYGFHVNHGRT